MDHKLKCRTKSAGQAALMGVAMATMPDHLWRDNCGFSARCDGMNEAHIMPVLDTSMGFGP